MNYQPTTTKYVGLSPSAGGALTITQRILGFMTWKTGVAFIAIIGLLFISYYIYTKYQPTFHANREHVPKDINSNKDATLMLFYVDWCPHCNTAKPEWESLKTEYDGKNINGYTITFVEYNCTTESEEITQLIDKYSIEGYPTIKLIKDNQVIEYDAKPTKSTMLQFLNTVL
jgi:thiol-disulfide isomerase/thioredoxin